jgi:predicted metal-dependent peptidase
VDTSGSTSAFWDGFITEAQWCLDTLRPSKLTVLQCDTRITSRQEFEPGDNIVQAVTIRGGGGTDFRPIFEALENECETPSVLVFLTDMDGTMPDHAPQYPVLWIKTNQTAAPFGDSIQL